MSDEYPFIPGTYLLFNKENGTTLTLESDHRTISAADFNSEGSLYQMWTFTPTDTIGEYLIQSAAQSPQGTPLYITFDRVLRDEAAVIAGRCPVPWIVVNRGRDILMTFSNTPLLLGQGSEHGPKVQLLALTETQDYLDADCPVHAFSLWSPYTWHCIAVRPESRE